MEGLLHYISPFLSISISNPRHFPPLFSSFKLYYSRNSYSHPKQALNH
ncbi:hypothetical protein KSS87_000244, partial [Heliosperma pusillum]